MKETMQLRSKAHAIKRQSPNVLKKVVSPLIFLFTVISFSFSHQSTSTQATAAKLYKANTDWQLDATVSGVEFYHSIVRCGQKSVVFLKFHNTSSSVVKVSWKEVFVTKQQNGNKAEGPFREKQLSLLPGETSQSDCENIKEPNLLTRPEQTTPVYKAEIVKFSFQDIKVSK